MEKVQVVPNDKNINDDELIKLKKKVTAQKIKADEDTKKLNCIGTELKNATIIKESLELKKEKLQSSLQYYEGICKHKREKYNELEIIYTRTEIGGESIKRKLVNCETAKEVKETRSKDDTSDADKTEYLNHELQVLKSQILENDQVLTQLVNDLNLQETLNQ